MEYDTLFQTVLTILSSIITGGFVLVFVEIGNRRNRENDRYDFLMTPFIHKLSAFFRYICWCNGRICYPKSLNHYENQFKLLIEKVGKYGGRIIIPGGDYGVNYFTASELRIIAEDINNIWYYYEKMKPCNLKWKASDPLNTEELIKRQLKEISPEYLSRAYDVKLMSDISSDFYIYVYQPIEYNTFMHEACLSHYRRTTIFLSFSVTLVFLVLCSMLFVKLPMLILQLSTVLIVLLLLISLLFLGIDMRIQIRWYSKLKAKIDIFYSKIKRTASKRKKTTSNGTNLL